MTDSSVKVGEVYDRLTVVSFHSSEGKEHGWRRKWVCHCECGNIIVARQGWLRNEPGIKQCQDCRKKYRPVRCSWNRKFLQVGQRFGTLTIEKCLEHTLSDKQVYYLARCDCGNTRILQAHDFELEPTCNQGLCQKRTRRSKWIGELSGKHWYTIVRCAGKRGIPVDITQQYAWDLFLEQNRRCVLSGIELFMDDLRKHRECTASLDRINSFRCYQQGHVQWIHKALNEMKIKSTDKEFIRWCELVVRHTERDYPYEPTNYMEKYPQLEPRGMARRRKGCGLIEAGYWGGLREKAGRREIPFEVTIQEAWNLLQQQDCRCALTGLELIFRKPYSGEPYTIKTASVDRIDSLRPYVLDNIRWVHKGINWMKLNYTDEEFLHWCQLVTNHQVQKELVA